MAGESEPLSPLDEAKHQLSESMIGDLYVDEVAVKAFDLFEKRSVTDIAQRLKEQSEIVDPLEDLLNFSWLGLMRAQ